MDTELQPNLDLEPGARVMRCQSARWPHTSGAWLSLSCGTVLALANFKMMGFSDWTPETTQEDWSAAWRSLLEAAVGIAGVQPPFEVLRPAQCRGTIEPYPPQEGPGCRGVST